MKKTIEIKIDALEQISICNPTGFVYYSDKKLERFLIDICYYFKTQPNRKYNITIFEKEEGDYSFIHKNVDKFYKINNKNKLFSVVDKFKFNKLFFIPFIEK